MFSLTQQAVLVSIDDNLYTIGYNSLHFTPKLDQIWKIDIQDPNKSTYVAALDPVIHVFNLLEQVVPAFVVDQIIWILTKSNTYTLDINSIENKKLIPNRLEIIAAGDCPISAVEHEGAYYYMDIRGDLYRANLLDLSTSTRLGTILDVDKARYTNYGNFGPTSMVSNDGKICITHGNYIYCINDLFTLKVEMLSELASPKTIMQ